MMASGATSDSVTGKASKSEKSRRTWTTPEEEVLLVALKDVANKGWKSENGFRAGYLPLLESAMRNAFPNTDLRGNPHIISKIHVWKKQYGILASMLAKSGIGWNDTENMIDASNEAWEALLKVDSSVKILRYKRWPYYHEWCEIFGTDRATGDKVETFSAAVQDILNMTEQITNEMDIGLEDVFHADEVADDSMSVTPSPTSNPYAASKTKQKKRKVVHEVDDKIVTAINNLADITKETMSNLVREMAADSKKQKSIRLENDMDIVLATLGTILELTSDEKVRVAEVLVDNPNKLCLFLRLGSEGKLSLCKSLLNP